MTKTGRRALFLLVATVANMLLTVLIIVVVVAALGLIFPALGLKAPVVIMIVAFLAGVVLSGLAYGKVLKILRKRPDLEERFGLLK
jgi:hypothetical protein